MSHTHTIVQCRYCDATIAQCCPGQLDSYQVRPETCDTCEQKLRLVLGQIPDDAVGKKKPEPKKSCCEARRKVVVAVAKILPVEVCGIHDAVLADFLDHEENSPGGKPILRFRFCPWCGQERGPNRETRVVETA